MFFCVLDGDCGVILCWFMVRFVGRCVCVWGFIMDWLVFIVMLGVWCCWFLVGDLGLLF